MTCKYATVEMMALVAGLIFSDFGQPCLLKLKHRKCCPNYALTDHDYSLWQSSLDAIMIAALLAQIWLLR